MRSSVRRFAVLFVLLTAGAMGVVVAQVSESSVAPQASSLNSCGYSVRGVTRDGSAKTPEPSSQTQDQVNSAKTSDVSAQAADQSTSVKSPDVSSQASDQTKTPDIPVEKSKIHWHLGTISVGAGYASGPYYDPYGSYPFGPYGFYPGDWVYSSFAYPLWGPYPFYPAGSFDYNGGRGEIRLTADPKQAEVYIDGAYAGTADRLKNIWLDPGAYDLTVSSKDRESFHQRIYILSGKSLKIMAKLGSEKLGSDATKEKL